MCTRPFNRALFACLAALAHSCLIFLSRAAVLESTFDQTAIPDNSPAGVVLNFANAPAAASVDQVTLTIAHEWLGDLSVRLIPPSGPGFVLFQRVGVSATNAEGVGAVLGSFVATSSNVFQLTPATYAFSRTGLNLATEASNAVDVQPGATVPANKVYAGQLWEAGPFPAGQWQLLISDSAPFSTGVVVSAQIDYTSVPEPSTLALLGVAVALFGASRKRSLLWLKQRRP